MFQFMTAQEAVGLVKDGDTIAINAFLTIANPEKLHQALYERIRGTGSPAHLTLFCSAGYGGWDEHSYGEPYTALGAVDCVVAGHFASMPVAGRMVMENRIEGYNLPLGVMSHMVRAAAGRKPGVLSRIGMNLFVDPKNGGGRLNERSKQEWVKRVQFEGQELLFYTAPQLDVAFIKGTTADNMGNVSFEKECATVDALSLAQAVKANGGRVIVQVERISSQHQRPRNVIIPGILIDAIVVDSAQQQLAGQPDYNPSYSGDVYVPVREMGSWISRMERSDNSGRKRDVTHQIIARRAVRELSAGDVVNIGIGVPEQVALAAARTGLLRDITLTVESGAIGGLPASGYSFGATIGADTIYDMAQQFDFYDGGGLDICFIGALEIDLQGNVNAHYSPQRISGIGGLANITQSTRKVVFCATFSASGLEAVYEDGQMRIAKEGKFPKFVEQVAQYSFAAVNAQQAGQEILYITERCVFRLTPQGLQLTEVLPGVDVRKDILDKLPGRVLAAEPLQEMII